ncbi:hypothetical protein ACIBCS_36155 [Streptomyces phaeochromogenes]|uniref:hypothetical protein n=1 Tax=Streptomyces phaeochromogenes TaxID=1923 RepID=UPI0033D376B9
MNEAWAAVVAVAAGVFALAGGYYGSRRQADVEHGQWQRGQRQEAYLALLDAWDAAMRKLTDIAADWDHQLYGEQEQRAGDDFSDVITARTRTASSAARARRCSSSVVGQLDVHGTAG